MENYIRGIEKLIVHGVADFSDKKIAAYHEAATPAS